MHNSNIQARFFVHDLQTARGIIFCCVRCCSNKRCNFVILVINWRYCDMFCFVEICSAKSDLSIPNKSFFFTAFTVFLGPCSLEVSFFVRCFRNILFVGVF